MYASNPIFKFSNLFQAFINHSECINCHWYYCCIAMIQLYKYTDAGKSRNTFFSSGTTPLLTFLTFSFSTWGERDTHTICIMLNIPTSSFSQLSSWTGRPESNLNSLTQQTRRASRNPQLDCPGPGSNLAQIPITTHCFFQKSPKFPAHRFRAWRHSHPGLVSYLGLLLWHLWLSHPPRTSVNTCTENQIVQSLTKPNAKI